MANESRIAGIIRQLIAQADSTSHPEEAETFMAKANSLMTKYGLDLLDLGRLNNDDPLAAERDAFTTSASYPWARKIAAALARYYGCELVYYKIKSRNVFVYDLIGRESARVTFLLMFPYVKRQVAKLSAEAFNEGHYNSRMQAATHVGNATAVRIARMAAAAEADRMAKPASAGGGTGVNALVPVDAIAALMAEEFPDVKVAKPTSTKYDHVAQEKAKRVNVNRQATKASANRMIGKA